MCFGQARNLVKDMLVDCDCSAAAQSAATVLTIVLMLNSLQNIAVSRGRTSQPTVLYRAHGTIVALPSAQQAAQFCVSQDIARRSVTFGSIVHNFRWTATPQPATVLYSIVSTVLYCTVKSLRFASQHCTVLYYTAHPMHCCVQHCTVQCCTQDPTYSSVPRSTAQHRMTQNSPQPISAQRIAQRSAV
jgi:hypothetical protein